MLNKDLIRRLSVFNVFFFSLGGYYIFLILVTNLASSSLSRYVTIPIRVVIIFSILYLFTNKKINKRDNISLIAFSLFSLIYILKILFSMLSTNNLYMSEQQFLFYFISFVFISVIFVSFIKMDSIDYEIIFNTIICSCIGVSILTYMFYGDLLGNVGRISYVISKDENYISPLALSYVSVLGISLSVSYIMANKISIGKKVFLYCSILFCLIPFFLGASRGAIIALLITFAFYTLASRGIIEKVKVALTIVIMALLLFLVSEYAGTNAFERFFNISSDIESQNSSSVRLYLWESAFLQFMDFPLFGGSLQLENIKHHPHNIIVEVLMTTGLMGFFPFMIFTFCIFIKAIKIVQNKPEMFWLTNIFLVGFTMNMFSGAIWGASWFALGSALIIGFDLRERNYV